MIQADLFDPRPSGPALRDGGMAIAAEAQDRDSPGWSERAYAAIFLVARRQSLVHVDDILVAFTERPHHPNAWGAVWMRAIRDGVIERAGTVRPCTRDRGKHAHNYPEYRSLVCGAAG